MKMGIMFAVVFATVFGLAMPFLGQREPAESSGEATEAEPHARPQEPQAAVRPPEETEKPKPPAQAVLPSIPTQDAVPPSTLLPKTPPEPIKSASPRPETRLAGHEIYARALKSTVWINNPGMGFGSGSLINAEEKLVLTNYHVVFRSSFTQDLKPLQVVESSLTGRDARDKTTNLPCKVFEFQATRKHGYVIDMESRDVDAYLEIHTVRGQLLGSDDDSGGELNARVFFFPPQDGKYRIVASTYGGGLGKFTLRISQTSMKPGQHGAVRGSVASHVIVNFPAYRNGEVVPDKNHYLAVNLERDRFKAKVLAWDEAKDLAVVQLASIPEGAEPLPLARESSQPGQLVHSIGNPGGSGALWVYTSGTVRTAPYNKKWHSSGPEGKMSHDAFIVETQSPTNPGDSGGPLVNENVELVAVTQGSNLHTNAISLFVDVREVRAFCRKHGFRWVER